MCKENKNIVADKEIKFFIEKKDEKLILSYGEGTTFDEYDKLFFYWTTETILHKTYEVIDKDTKIPEEQKNIFLDNIYIIGKGLNSLGRIVEETIIKNDSLMNEINDILNPNKNKEE